MSTAAISRDSILDTIDLLQERRFVHVFCRLQNSLPAIGTIIADYINRHEAEPSDAYPEWRGIVLGATWNIAVQALKHSHRKINVSSVKFWNAAVHGRYGRFHAVGYYPDSVSGIVGDNLFFVLLRNHNQDIWNALWPSVVGDTRILAVNSELFSEKGDFAYVDWGE